MFSLREKHELVAREDSAPAATANIQIASIDPQDFPAESILVRAGDNAKAAVNAVRDLAASLTKDIPLMDDGLDMRPAPTAARPKLSREEICSAMELAALEHKIPMEFFGRLIWQESRHNAVAVSHAGARGIAQFMPGTAADIGLKDPFDPVTSLLKSAEFLRMLHKKFGNVGLAAAAYNGGPGRLERWLETRAKNKKAALPKETQDYVRIITGKRVDEWVGVGGEKAADLKHTKTVPCVAAPIIEAKAPEKAEPEKFQKVASADPAPWNVRVMGAWSQQKAHERFAALKIKYPAMLGARRLSVSSTKVAKGKQATLIHLAAASQAEGQQLCTKLKETGGSCTVQKNVIKTASKS